MKSAYELAMERLEQKSPTVPLTEEQKTRIAEIDNLYTAKKAEREVFLRGEIAKASAAGKYNEVLELEEQLKRELRRIDNERDEKKTAVRGTQEA
jgi:hypothetical protein